MSNGNAPIEAKVKTSTLASILTTLALGLLGQYVFTSGVPDFVEVFVSSAILSAVTGAVTFVTGWATRHTHRYMRIDQDNNP